MQGEQCHQGWGEQCPQGWGVQGSEDGVCSVPNSGLSRVPKGGVSNVPEVGVCRVLRVGKLYPCGWGSCLSPGCCCWKVCVKSVGQTDLPLPRGMFCSLVYWTGRGHHSSQDTAHTGVN